MRKPRRKAEETRKDILATAETLFRQHGIAKCAIADIAHALSMSPANIFKHFQSKTALADAVCELHIDRMVGRLESLDETAASAPDRLAVTVNRLMEAHLHDIRENPFLHEMVFLMSQADLPSGRHYKERIEDLFARLIREGVESGAYLCTDPVKVGRHVAAAFASVLHPVMLSRSQESELHDRCDGIIELVNAALRNPLAK